ncbi:MAG: DNA methylase, partial [Clostridia bacterium]|nr:DNA methylase [Clostridia bacterium]
MKRGKSILTKVNVHCSHDKMLPISKLKPHPQNPNIHPERQIKLLSEIIRKSGWRHPILVSKRSGY